MGREHFKNNLLFCILQNRNGWIERGQGLIGKWEIENDIYGEIVKVKLIITFFKVSILLSDLSRRSKQ